LVRLLISNNYPYIDNIRLRNKKINKLSTVITPYSKKITNNPSFLRDTPMVLLAEISNCVIVRELMITYYPHTMITEISSLLSTLSQ